MPLKNLKLNGHLNSVNGSPDKQIEKAKLGTNTSCRHDDNLRDLLPSERQTLKVPSSNALSDLDGESKPPYSPSPALTIAPEGGYGWVIVGAAFLCSFVVDGVANSFGIYLIEFNDLFVEPESITSWIGSLLVGVYLFMGPIACGLADTFGYRIVIACGAVTAACGFGASFFVTNVYVLFLTFGIIGGIGFGFIYSPSIMCVCSYFQDQSALAVGIAVCGSSVGGMVFPNFVQLLLDYYGWQGSMLFLAGTALQCCIAAALMRNPQHKTLPALQITKATSGEDDQGCLPPLIRQALADMINFHIYRVPTFLIYSCASFIGSIAFLTPSFFLPSFAIEKFPIDKDTAATVITAICGAGIIGRIFFGALADRPRFDALKIHNLCIFASGVTLALVPMCTSFTGLLINGVVYGFFIAPYISLMSIILSSRMGLEQLPIAFGQTQLLAGIASMIGPPLHGTVEGKTTSSVPFYFAGAAWILASLVASLIFLLPNRLKRCEFARSKSSVNGSSRAISTNAEPV
ncbi:monocarboxylate transporter 13-like [Paramacrobiotus metropolitanus]|uniref:monocarboxylate transporter 13-like n=1 Tax=Paramacrobiotus metropolitanus TaxID=2943436 RepID=UPI002446437C|nr:monocarboxylate transporter 13-like [Paramacrobiotus metropolitanus]